MPFTSLGLSPALLKALTDHNFTSPTLIQQAVIPAILNKRDVLGIAKTGSGKTAGYVLPILTNIQPALRTKNRHVNVLVLVPTRELAVQVTEVFQLFGQALPETIKSMAVYGGVSINPQMMSMQGVNILIATPGRLLELVAANAVHLSDIETLVLDEADKMLNLGFKAEMDKIIALLPAKRQNLLFSATLSQDIEHINQILLHDPEVIKIEEESSSIANINQVAYLVPEDKKGPFLRHLIKQHDMKQVLVFAVYNNTDSTRTFCKWHTPFERLMSKYLDVRDEAGQEVDYRGAMAKRMMPPPADSFITVKKGDSISVVTDLKEGYAILKPGKYSIKYNSSDINGLVVKDSISVTIK